MKTSKQSKNLRSRLAGGLLIAGTLAVTMPFLCPSAEARATVSASATVSGTSESTTLRYSAGIEDILKMVDAKVDTEVVKAYIKNSSTAYNPNVSEIIALKDHGVPSDVITAVLQHGAEVRSQAARSMQANVAPAVAPQPYANTPYPYGQAPAYGYGSQPVYADYGYNYPVYSSAYSDYGYPYYSYPYYVTASVSPSRFADPLI